MRKILLLLFCLTFASAEINEYLSDVYFFSRSHVARGNAYCNPIFYDNLTSFTTVIEKA